MTAILATAVSCFTLGMMHSRRTQVESDASYDAKLQAVRTEVRAEIDKGADA